LLRKNAGHQLVESVKALVAQVTREKTNSPAVLEKQLKTLQEALQQPSTQ
jgi:hypothetical protein